MELNVNEIMNKIEITNKDSNDWVVTIKGFDYDLHSCKNVEHYSDDEGFLQEGLPAALIATRLAGEKFEKYTISEVYFSEDDWIIPSELHEFDYPIGATVTKGSKKYDLTKISDEEARDIIRNFLTSDIFYTGEFSEEYIEKVTNEIIPKEKVKKKAKNNK